MPDIDSSQLNISPDATDEEKAKAYSDYFGVPLVHLKGKEISLDVLSKIPFDVTKAFDIVAYEFDETKTPNVLKIAVGDAARLQKKAPAILSELKKQKGTSLELAVTTREDFDYVLNYYKKLMNEQNNPKKTSDNEQSKVAQPSENKEFPMVDLREIPTPYQVLTKFPEEVATRYQIVVFEAPSENKIKVAAVDPKSPKVRDILDFVRERNKINIELYETSLPSLTWALRGYRNIPKVAPEITKPQPLEKEIISQTTQKSGAMPAEEIKREAPKFINEETLPKKEAIQPKIEPKPENINKKAEEIRTEEISASGLRQTNEPQENMQKIQPTIDEEEKNLDNVLPNGINNVEELKEAIKAGFIPKTLAAIIFFAVIEGASDIHIEADKQSVRLRYRIDGLLRDILKLPLELQAPIISRIKILSKLKIDETRIPQDGRFEAIAKGKDIDLRVSTLPTVHGEKVVLRILDKSSQLLNLEDLGVTGNASKILEKNIRKPYGIILSTGPTGSGKTTTLYSIINKINNAEINVVTLEDPVEYEIPDVNQCQIKPKIGFGFAEGLRSILRQDPNIIMVGEIRDQETASMATHAALTGHLVLSTLHTNDASSALPRLINMGVEPFLITSAINCIIAQRLVRKICSKCKEEYNIPQATKEEIKIEIEKSENPEIAVYKNKELKFYHGKGCPDCVDGYKGRIGIFEILDMTDKVEDLAVSRAPATAIRNQAIKDGMLTMKEDGIIKVLKGITTIDEILRVTSE